MKFEIIHFFLFLNNLLIKMKRFNDCSNEKGYI